MKSLERKLIAGIISVSILLIITGAVFFNALNNANDKAAQVAHTNEVLTELEATLSTLKDAETGQRGYIITGQENYLEPFNEADQHTGERMERLKALTQNSQPYLERLAAAALLIKAKFDLMHRTIVLRRNFGFDAAQRVVMTNEGKAKMDAIRKLFAAMKADENASLQELKVSSEIKNRNVVITFAALFLLIFSLFGLVYFLVKRDINERSRFAIELQMMATTDELTGVFNRREANRLLKQEVLRSHRYGNQMAIMLLDIDHFKSVNDTYGHQIGDEVLKWFAAKLRESVRTVDLPARFGGEEFLVVLPETDEAGALIIAERTRRKIAETPFVWEKINGKTFEIPITVSIGVAGMNEIDSETKLVKIADKALYQAKTDGRNRVVSGEQIQMTAAVAPQIQACA